MYKHTNSQIKRIFISIIQDKSKLDNLLYQQHVQTKVLQ